MIGKWKYLLKSLISLFFVFVICNGWTAEEITDKPSNIKSAQLCFELKNSLIPGKDIFINGKKAAQIPLTESEIFEKVSINIPKASSIIATVNILNIENISDANKKKDFFSIRNIFLKVETIDNITICTNTEPGPFESFKAGFTGDQKENRRYMNSGSPLPTIRLILSAEKLGYIKQPSFFNGRSGEAYRNSQPRKWLGLEKICANRKKRTICDIRVQEFIAWQPEYILDILAKNNSDILMTDFSEKLLKNQKDKIALLRKKGIRINLLFGSNSMKGAYARLPESDQYRLFFRKLAEWAPLVDMVGLDEWFLSPAVLKTDGGNLTEIDEKFLYAFAQAYAYSHEDAEWAFKNHSSDDPRAIKAWEFCSKVQNDFASKFAQTAKKANPGVRTWISYITRNWNKSVTCIDSAVNEFDDILQCQTYWYGRASENPLESPVITAPIGMGKIFKNEYPDKFLWMGIDPGYMGGDCNICAKSSWARRFYNNTPEECVPYLALLYAVSNGVFIQSPGGTWFFREKPGIDGAYIDKFSDMIRLVSQIVPYIGSYRKNDIAYYYDPEADWEITRKVNRFIAARETTEISVGLLEQFCDVDVTDDIGKYENVIYAGLLLPAKFDYHKQNIYLLYSPEYDEKGNRISENTLLEKLDLKGFSKTGKNFLPAGTFNENGCTDTLLINESSDKISATGKTIEKASYPVRTAFFPNSIEKHFVIAARNKAGNVLIDSVWPSFIPQGTARTIIKKDLDYFGWTKRDCPQVNGQDKIVAVAFNNPRTAILDFGKEASISNVKIIVFNGKDGITRDETVQYHQGMEIRLQPFNVLVAIAD